MEYILGIDLGTTNSCVFYQDEAGTFKVINIENSNILPSVVSFKDNKILIGKQAENQKIIAPKETVYAFKRLIGRRWDSQIIQTALSKYSYIITTVDNSTLSININGQLYSVEEMSALVLSKIKQEVSKQLGVNVIKAVITVPAYFNENQRKSTKDAGAIAGLDVIRIINEPTAAALAYGFRQGKNQHILVYDLGGGTFDCTILEITDEVFEVIASAGDTFLGGEDFTDMLVEWINADILERFDKKFNLYKDAVVYQRIKDVAEKSKKELSSRQTVNIDLPFLFIDSNRNTVNYSAIITRDEFNEITQHLVEKSIDILSKTINHLNISKDSIDQILLVGGQTRMPLVQEKIENFFQKPVSKGINPDEAVALGAAIQGSLLVSNKTQSVLLDVISQSMGIMVAGGFYEKIIDSGSVVPCSAEKVFMTIRDNQTTVEINVFQGESWKAEENTYLGTIKITELLPLPMGEVKINVKFIVNSEGILKVEATNLKTNETHNLVIEGTSGLSANEIKELKEKCELVYSKSEKQKELNSHIDTVKKTIPQAVSILKNLGKPTTKVEQYQLYIDNLETMKNIPIELFDNYINTLKTIIQGLEQLIRVNK